MNYNKLKSLLKDRKISIRQLVRENIGMGEVGLHQAIKNDSLSVRVLENIAKVLNVPVGYFFDDYENSSFIPGSEVDTLQRQVMELQRQLIAEKERVIKLMEKIK